MKLQNWQLWDNKFNSNKMNVDQKKQSDSYESLQNISTQSNQSLNDNMLRMGIDSPVSIRLNDNEQKVPTIGDQN